MNDRYGYIVDNQGLYLREISKDNRLTVWTQNREDALIFAESNAKDELFKQPADSCGFIGFK